MSSPAIETIGFDHFIAGVPILRICGEDALADELEAAAEHFCRALALHRRSPAYRVRLRPPFALGAERLAAALLRGADRLRQGEAAEAAVGDWCCALAARLAAISHEPDIRVSRLLVFVNIDANGRGALVLSRLEDEALVRFPGLSSPRRR